jgi:hypothetical protein
MSLLYTLASNFVQSLRKYLVKQKPEYLRSCCKQASHRPRAAEATDTEAPDIAGNAQRNCGERKAVQCAVSQLKASEKRTTPRLWSIGGN